MKIAFSGASSTGKTTIATGVVDALAASGASLHRTNVDARSILDCFPDQSVARFSPELYKIFQCMYVGQKILIEQDDENFITERSYIDCLSYWMLHCRSVSTSEEMAHITKICVDGARKYRFHFLFPAGAFPVADDGYRNTDLSYQLEFDRVIRATYKRHSVEFIEVPIATIQERVKFVIDYIHE
jgi:predicted ATPase